MQFITPRHINSCIMHKLCVSVTILSPCFFFQYTVPVKVEVNSPTIMAKDRGLYIAPSREVH